MPKFRIDAIIRAKDGNLKVLAAHDFEAESNADVERLADDWARGAPVGMEADFRIVRANLILAERRMRPREMELVVTADMPFRRILVSLRTVASRGPPLSRRRLDQSPAS